MDEYTNDNVKNVAKHISDMIHAAVTNDTIYESYFAWKKQNGLRASFVRKLFLSTDFITCRVCEYLAQTM